MLVWLAFTVGATPQPFLSFPTNVLVGAPAVSPDGSLVVFTRYITAAPGGDIGGADLYLADLAGGPPRLLLAHDASGVSFDEPAWSGDGSAVYFTRRAARYQGTQLVSEDIRIDRVGLDGSGRAAVVQDASSPALALDGQQLGYLSPGVRDGLCW
jgi:Tol biopolymer transport system component